MELALNSYDDDGGLADLPPVLPLPDNEPLTQQSGDSGSMSEHTLERRTTSSHSAQPTENQQQHADNNPEIAAPQGPLMQMAIADHDDSSGWSTSEEEVEATPTPDDDGEWTQQTVTRKAPWFTPFYGIAFDLLRKFGDVEHSDFWVLEEGCQSYSIYDHFLKHWRVQEKKEHPSFYFALFAALWQDIFMAIFFQFLFALFSLFPPILLNLMLTFLLNPTQPSYYGYIYASCLAVAAFVSIYFFYRSRWRTIHVGIKLRGILALSIYDKILTKPDFPSGVIINLFASDAQTLTELLPNIIPGIVAPFQILAVIGILGYFVGWVCCLVLVTLILVIVINYFMAKIIMRFRRQLGTLSDKRLKFTAEMIEGIRIVKYYAWEDAFENRIAQAREEELMVLRKMQICRVIIFFTLNCATPFSLLLTFIAYGLSHPTLDTKVAFTIVGFLNLLVGPFQNTGIAVIMLSAFTPSLGRIGQFFQSPTLTSYVENTPADAVTKPFVEIKDGVFKWPKSDTDTLRDLNFRVNEGDKLLVIGKVGSGKSSVLECLMGNIPKKQGTVTIGGSVAYLPQTAWIYNATVRENILFGTPYNAKRYKKVVQVVELVADFKQWPNEDLTEMGERGVNLSGGQRQRIAIARSLYVEKDIYLFDDSLSALDPIVQQSLFINGLMRLLRKKIVIFVTNQLHFLSYPGLRVLYIENGQQKMIGTLPEIQHSEEISHLIIQSGVDVNGGQAKKTIERHSSLMPTSREFKGKIMSAESREKGRIIKREEKRKGLVEFRTYFTYVMRGGLLLFAFVLFCQLATVALNVYSSFWLSQWATATSGNATNSSNSTNGTATSVQSQAYYMGIYFTFLIGFLIFNLFNWIVAFLIFAIRASRIMHAILIEKLVHATVSFFDVTPAARITTRLTLDMFLIDFVLPAFFVNNYNLLFQIAGSIAGVFLGAWYIGIVIIPLFPVYYAVLEFFKLTYVEVQRLEALSRSPPISHLQMTIQGIDVIRSFGAGQKLLNHQARKVDENNMDKWVIMLLYCWMAFRIELLGGLVQVCLFLGLTIVRNYFPASLNPSTVGIALSFTMGLPITLGLFVNGNAEIEAKMNAVERLDEFIKIDQEGKNALTHDDVQFRGWDLEFRQLNFAYRSGPVVLNNISFYVKHGEKVGIVGRTGSGKSSLIQALLRIVEPEAGTVYIDGIDFQSIPLPQLRSSMSVIPQEPVLFMGTVRYNLDPFNSYQDSEVWRALAQVELKEVIEALPEQLLSPVAEGGKNFSVGQRQLFCLARALLKNSQILLLDEATASVDIKTDQILQRMIRTQLNNCTVLTIAHRINTIIDYDKILVLDMGRLLEYDSPFNLVQRESVFLNMVRATGDISDSLIESVLHKGRAA